MIPLRDSQPSYTTPVVTLSLIVVNVLAFLYEISLDPFSLNHFIATYGVIPDRLDPFTLLTSMFLHGGWMHLIGNMWFLWIYGDNVEDILGRGKFLLFYLLSGIAAGLVHVAFNPYSRVPTIGASGAIAGVMGAYMVKFPRSRIITLVPIFVFLTTVEVPASIILLYWFVIQFFSGLGTIGESHLSQGGVAWFAHVGGFVAGAILIKLFRTRERWRRRPDLHW
ncbi:MAG: rhomboid family intramembrane serine protease [Bryobacterales bacterium]|nr:rhomboid family intramembrane serine protease [Bryobacteraceae bacterium]MDW8353219.1 rhomboid family intramembrane serine protease [Bryobacterales bacterium]